MPKPTVADVLFGGLLAWTVGVSAYVARLEFRRGPARVAPTATSVPNWRTLRGAGFAMGPHDAQRSVVVFSDFQCPYCRGFAAVVDSLRSDHPEVLVVERHLPLVDLHDAALDAALAAECARDVGRYAEMRRVLFQRRQLVAEEEWGRLANLAGIPDTAELTVCVSRRMHIDHVNADLAAAHGLGIEGTPGVIINDSLFNGTMTLAVLESRLGLNAANEKSVSR